MAVAILYASVHEYVPRREKEQIDQMSCSSLILPYLRVGFCHSALISIVRKLIKRLFFQRLLSFNVLSKMPLSLLVLMLCAFYIWLLPYDFVTWCVKQRCTIFLYKQWTNCVQFCLRNGKTRRQEMKMQCEETSK